MSNVPMTRPQEMLAIHDRDFGSSFVELDDGRILSAGQGKFAYSEDGGITWGEPFERVDADGNQAVGDMTVKLSGNNSIGIAERVRAWHVSREERQKSTYRDMAHVAFRRSDDGGETWSAPVRMSPEGTGTYAVRDSMTRTSSGRIIMPVYIMIGGRRYDERWPTVGKLVNGQYVGLSGHYFDPSFSAVYVVYSDDEGETWQRNEDGELMIPLDWNTGRAYVNEPSLAEVAPGRLLMMMRNGLGRLFQSWSSDDGETWTNPLPTSLAASTTPAQIRSIPSTGHLLIVWNQESLDDVRRGWGRTRMSSAVSRNAGSVWEFFQNVESMLEETRVEPGPIEAARPAEVYFKPGQAADERDSEYVTWTTGQKQCSYPTVCVLKDRVLIQYGYFWYEEHPTEARLVRRGKGGPSAGGQSRLKVLPLSWFYGGKEPADNPVLAPAFSPETP